MSGRVKKVILLLLFLFVLVACNNPQEVQDGGDSSPFLNLSTDNQEEEQPMESEQLEQPEQSEQSLESPLNELIENREQPEEGEEKEVTDKSEGIGEPTEVEEIPQNQEDLQKALPTEPVSPEKMDGTDGTNEKEQFDVQTSLPFENFRERWNAVSDANYSNLYIKDFTGTPNDLGVTYVAALDGQMEIRVFVVGDYVQSIGINAVGNINIPKMLTGWSQIINILYPEIEIHDVDEFFNELGVRPNGDLSKLKEGTFARDNLNFAIKRIDNGFLFEGSYQ